MITIINERQGYNMSENNQSLRMAQLALQAMEEKIAEDIKIIDIHEVSTIADYFLIASGNNRSQIQAICDEIEETLGRAGYPEKQSEGYDTANWILMDYHDIIVHIFDKQNRLFYDLERIWRDGKEVTPEELNG